MKYGKFESDNARQEPREPVAELDFLDINVTPDGQEPAAEKSTPAAPEGALLDDPIWSDPFFADLLAQDAADPEPVSEQVKSRPEEQAVREKPVKQAPGRKARNLPAKDKPVPEELDELPLSEAENKPKKKENPQKSMMMYLHDLVYLICGILLVLLLCFRVVVVSGDSMKNTLVDGDYLLLLSNIFYREPKQGDIIVASKDSFRDGEPIVKRVIATEGQTVDIDFEAGIVYVDGKELDEPYINSLTTTQEGVSFPLTVDEGCVFVMGDNRGISMDSRSTEIGLIDTREILGKAIFLLLPGTDGGRSSRFFYRIGVLA